jgi:hypothetical protein
MGKVFIAKIENRSISNTRGDKINVKTKKNLEIFAPFNVW